LGAVMTAQIIQELGLLLAIGLFMAMVAGVLT
jgi:hypothetical protein